MLLRAKIKKERGILLPLSSLPSKHGIGSFGKEAFDFVELLSATGQACWQILPLCPVGKGNSPYASLCGFAMEILYIDLEQLKNEGLLKEEELGNPIFPKNVDYKAVREYKIPLLRLATSRFNCYDGEYKAFLKKNEYWLRDFALFMAIRQGDIHSSFLDFEEGLKYRLPDSIKEFESTHERELEFFKLSQYFAFKQYKKLRSFAHGKGIKIIGDIPFYVNFNSADVWANSEVFKLGRDMHPTSVAGVPPDRFCPKGQLWGNPIYNWEYLKKTGYSWWLKRLIHNAELYDVIRIDHFRAFSEYFSIPASAENAGEGKWEKGPAFNFWETALPYLRNTEILAEDLGGEDSLGVIELLRQTGFPNMKVLHFAFDSDLSNPFLPKNFGSRCTCYTGTHDNNTTLGWYKNLSQKERLLFQKSVPEKYSSPVLDLISFALNSRAKRVIIPMQDYLQLDADCRLNIPGTPEGNWEWRLGKNDINDKSLKLIRDIK